MNILKKVWISLKRNCGKTFLFFTLIATLGSVAIFSVLVSQAVLNTEESLRRNLPPITTIELQLPIDFDFDADTIEELSIDIINEISELPYVLDMDHSFHAFWSNPNNSTLSGVTVDVEGDESAFTPEFLTTQYSSRPDFIDLNTRLINIIDGRTFTEEEMNNRADIFPVIISNEFASLNQLSVDSIFPIYYTIRGEFFQDGDDIVIMGTEEIGRIQFEFKVVGIFELTREIIAGDALENAISTSVMLNRFYTPNWVSFQTHELRQLFLHEKYDWWEIETYPEDPFWFQIAFLLRDPLDLVAFEKAAQALLPDHWEVVTLSNTFAPLTAAMDSITWMAEAIALFVVGVSVIVLTLFVMLNLHDRKYEIGVYLALGEKRLKIVLQIMLEVLLSGTLAIAFSIAIGNLLAHSFSEQILYQQIGDHEAEIVETFFTPETDPLHWFSSGDLSIEEMMEQYEVTLETEIIMWFYGLSIIVLSISSVLPIAYILRLSPSKILLNKQY